MFQDQHDSSLIIHSIRGVAVVLVTDLVNFLFPSRATIEPVGTIDHDPINVADVLVRMNYARRDQHRRRIVLADDQRASTQERL